MPFKKTPHFFLFFGLVISGLTTYSVNVFAGNEINVNIDIGATRDDNLNNSPSADFAIEDDYINANIGVGIQHKLNKSSLLNIDLNAATNRFKEENGLDNNSINLAAAYLYKPVGGFNSPIYIFSTDVMFLDSQTDIRDQTIFNAQASISARITTTLTTAAGISASSAEAENSRVFDTKKSRFFINADLSLSRSTAMYLTYHFISGDSVSTLPLNDYPSNDLLNIINQADAIEWDPTFGAEKIAYRLKTKTNVITLGFNVVISPQHSLDFSAKIINAKADGNISYDRALLNFSYLASF